MKIKDLKNTLKKVHGDGFVTSVEDIDFVERLPTGIYPVDFSSGGGFPRGKFSIIWGAESGCKSNVAFKAIAMNQKLYPKQVNVIIDVEGSFDPIWGKRLGMDVNPDRLAVIRPDFAEQASDILQKCIQADDIGVIVFDSIGAMVTTNEKESTAEKASVGGAAKIVTSMMNKAIAGMSSQARNQIYPTVILINQMRAKIGVLYGCFLHDTRVTLSDGSQMKIGTIVSNKLPVEVMSVNTKTGEVQSKKVTGWHTNGKQDNWLKFTCDNAGGGNGISSFTCTPQHMIFNEHYQEIPAQQLSVEDKLLTRGDYYFNQDQKVLALSQILGGGSTRKSANRVQLRVGHGYKQQAYCDWKRSIFSTKVGYTYDNSGAGCGFDVSPSCDLLGYEDTPNLIPEIGLKGLAVWILDDAHFGGCYARGGWGSTRLSIKRWGVDYLHLGADLLADLGIPRPTVIDDTGLHWSGDRNRQLHEAIAKYAPKCMSYKIHPKLHNLLGTYKWDSNCIIRSKMVPSRIKSIEKVFKPRGLCGKYDITVEGNSNYLVDGCLVHNSPDCMNGGKTLAHASALTLKVRGRDIIDTNINKDRPCFKEVKGSIVKSKVPVLHKSFEFMFPLINQNGLRVGHIDDWKTLAHQMKDYGWLYKEGKIVHCLDMQFKTYKEVEAHFKGDASLMVKLRESLLEHAMELIYVDKEENP